MSHTYVRATFDFSTAEVGEIALVTGDIIQVLYEVDNNWTCGKLYGRVGNFPRNFVEPLTVPTIAPGQKVFAGIKDFPAQVDGDLGFKRGDLIRGFEAVDQNWWQGCVNGQTGIFPITHVQDLELVPPGDSITVPSRPLSGHVQVETEHTPQAGKGGVVATARANMDLTAQLDDELSFLNGDMIEITEVQDSDFAVGRCNGKEGSFPLAFVDVIEGSIEVKGKTSEKNKRHSKFDWWKENDTSSSPTPSPVSPKPEVTMPTATSPIPSDSRENKPVVSRPNSCVENIPTSDKEQGGAVISYDPGIYRQDLSPTHKRVGSYTEQNTFSASDGGITPYGKTLFPFVGENPNELTIFDNELVTLIRHVDEQWIEGEIDGKSGIFPSSYVEIIVDCPYDYSLTMLTPGGEPGTSSSGTKEPTTPQTEEYLERFTHDTFGCVLYDFKAEAAQDLDLHEGDTVTLLGKVHADWYNAKTDNGRVGLCPVSFVEVIPAEPSAIVGGMNGYISPSPSQEAILTNNNVTKPKVDPSGTDTVTNSPVVDKPTKPAKPPVLKPKPSLKPKPQLKPKPSLTVTAEVKNDTINETVVPKVNGKEPERTATKTQSKPSRPSTSPFLHKGFSSEASLDDIIQTELNLTKRQLSKEGDTAQSAQSLRADDLQSPELSPSFVDLTSSSMSVSFNKPMSMQPNSPEAMAISNSKFYFNTEQPVDNGTKSKVPSRPPPIPETKRQLTSTCSSQPPKRTPPPRPQGPHTAPQGLPLESTVGIMGPRPVPQRSAPPRPTETPVPAPRRVKRSPDDLMQFSPESAESPNFDQTEENMEVIQDLERKLEEIENDLKSYVESRETMTQALDETMDETQTAEVRDNLEFCEANISGLTEEKTQLEEVLHELCPTRASQVGAEKAAMKREEEERLSREEQQRRAEELKVKHRVTREKVIAEILQTEKDYIQSLSLCFETFFHTDTYKCPGVDIEMLLGNMDEVIEISQKLLNRLESATNGMDFDEQIIGICFVEVKEDMKRVYAPYCRNHDEVCALLAKYEKEPEIQACFTKMLEVMRQQTSVFDIGSVLIKPVQRILKYPLLLNELIKCTEDDHIDKATLLEGIGSMTDIAAAINEYKRRKDLVLKYKNTGETKFSEKMSRFTMHSTKKKLQRLSQKMVGIQTVDDNFNREERKFKNLESAVRVMVRDVSSYVENVQSTCATQEMLARDIADYYAEKNTSQDVEQFCKVHSQIASSIYYKFKDDAESKVINPLNRLLTMFQGPAKVIKKRYDKLLDYDNLSSRVKNTRDSEQLKSDKESLQMAKNNYRALNAQLLDELPKLYTLSLEVIQECVARLVQAQKEYYNRALEEMYHLLGLQLVLGDDLVHVIDTFNINHTAVVEQLSDICFIPKAFNPRVEDRRASIKGRRSSEMRTTSVDGGSGASPQSDSQKVYLRQQYSPDRLFYVAQTVGGSQPMDLDLTQGTLLGVIKEGDPMGNKDRWFIDTGAEKGFVYKQHLSPIKGGGTPGLPPPVVIGPPPGAVGGATDDGGDLLSFSPPESSPAQSPPSFSEAVAFEQVMGSTVWYSPSVGRTGQISHHAALPKGKISSQSRSLPSQDFDEYFDDSQSEKTLQNTPTATTNSGQEDIGQGQEVMSRPQSEVFEEDQLYQAVYAFTARTELEVDLAEGATVRVVQQHDLDGNSQWWLVENEKRQGYVPASYLYRLQCDDGMH